jgi:hypothetical protein
MNELIVLKSPRSLIYREQPNRTFEADEIVGVVDAGQTITKFGYEPSKLSYESSIQLAEGQPERIIDAYERTAASPPELREYINCHIFAFYALGKARKLKQHDIYPTRPLVQVDHENLCAGISYATVLKSGIVNHSLLGTGDGSKSLSVLGDHGIFALMKNETLKNFYGADRVVMMDLDEIEDKDSCN